MESSIRSDPRRSHPSIVARVLAGLALLGVIIAVLAVVSANSSDDGAAGGTDSKARSEQNRKTSPKADSYTVIPGDTLSGIAEKTGVPLKKIQRLNPDLDSETLNAGQVIKLKGG